MKRLILMRWLVCGLLPLAAHADDGARALGRLFFSPEERATLDAARQAAAIPPPVVTDEEVPLLPEAGITEIPAAPLPPPMTLNGFVARSAGPATVWVNGSVQDARDLSVPGGSAHLDRDALEVAFGAGGPTRRVKPGQTYDPATPTIREAHERAATDPGDVAAP